MPKVSALSCGEFIPKKASLKMCSNMFWKLSCGKFLYPWWTFLFRFEYPCKTANNVVVATWKHLQNLNPCLHLSSENAGI